jgi:hypothetical protein
MFRLLSRWLAGTSKRRSKSSKRRTFRPLVEDLEVRMVPAVTDMTALAQQLVSTPDAPTHLYLNFDGFQDNKHFVAPYKESPVVINDIMYRVSEIFSPFNVEVSRLYGFGNYDGYNGSTTVFVGDDSANNQTDPNTGAVTTNNVGGYTPAQFSDYPMVHNQDHVLHSNAFNLAFVDPVGVGADGSDTSWDMTQTAQAIAHEAGHTFGLAHVLSDNGNGTATPEIMSYSDVTNQYFADSTFNITDLNGGSDHHAPDDAPIYQGTALQTQDSFTYLGQVLGYRPGDGYHHVVHGDSIDPAYRPSVVTNLSNYSTKFGTIDRDGDYVVYRMQVSQSFDLNIDVTPTGAGGLSPTLLVYQNGDLVSFVDSSWNPASGQFEIHASVSVHGFTAQRADGSVWTKPETFAFVIGGANGDSTGNFELQTHGFIPIPLSRYTMDTLDPLSPPSILSTPAGAFGGIRGSIGGGSTGDTGFSFITAGISDAALLAPQDLSADGPVEGVLLSADEADTLGSGPSLNLARSATGLLPLADARVIALALAQVDAASTLVTGTGPAIDPGVLAQVYADSATSLVGGSPTAYGTLFQVDGGPGVDPILMAPITDATVIQVDAGTNVDPVLVTGPTVDGTAAPVDVGANVNPVLVAAPTPDGIDPVLLASPPVDTTLAQVDPVANANPVLVAGPPVDVTVPQVEAPVSVAVPYTPVSQNILTSQVSTPVQQPAALNYYAVNAYFSSLAWSAPSYRLAGF